ncbi:hypothetical protein Tco_1031962 [Tanacetum coccineum]|uniref:Uncharacterized protein n=1 Tax=Tanacetum coccineum TaxID=301880 RepID=A0ABQ5GAH1_9ASTR
MDQSYDNLFATKQGSGGGGGDGEGGLERFSRGVGMKEVVVGEVSWWNFHHRDVDHIGCLGGIMVNLIFLEEFEEEALVEFMGIDITNAGRSNKQVPSSFIVSSSLRCDKDGDLFLEVRKTKKWMTTLL